MKEQCTYCGSSRKIQNDHVIAQSKGGKSTVKACAICNQSKGAKSLMEWLRDVKEKDPYRWSRIINHNKNKNNVIAMKIKKIAAE